MKTKTYKYYIKSLIPLFIILCINLVIIPTSNAQKKKNKGDKKFSIERYQDAIKHYKKRITEGKDLAYSNFMVAESYRKTNRILDAIPYYKTTIENLIKTPNECCQQAYIYYAKGLKSTEEYDLAYKVLDEYLKNAKDSLIVKNAERELKGLESIKKIKEKPAMFKVKNLADINTAYDEFSPYYNKGYLYFTSNAYSKKAYKTDGTHFTNIFRVKSKGAKVNMKTMEEVDGINSANANDASIAMTKSGRYQVFAKGNTGKKQDRPDVDIFARIQRRGKWGAPFMLNLNDENSWDSSPYIIPSGKTVYFSSNRPGGYGGADLYSAKISRSGKWIYIKNLGPEINTAGDEMFPYIAENGDIYFASNGHPGFGGLDLFKALLKKGKYKVSNMGKPLNSPLDDFGIFFYNDKKGFFSSNRKGGKGRDDIYTFIDATPDKKTITYFLNITAYEHNATGEQKILPKTKILLLNTDNEELDTGLTSNEGKVRFSVSEGNNYFLVAQKNHYISKREGWSMIGKAIPLDSLTKSHTYKSFDHDMVLDIIKLEKTYTLENILYDFDKATLKDESKEELDKLVQIMKDTPNITVELGSHTDNKGEHGYNITLSQKRAESAVKYILQQNIDPKRITARGYGENKPVARNTNEDGSDNPEGRRLNRRTEFKITSYSKLKDEGYFDDSDSNNDNIDDENKDKNNNGSIELDINDLLDP